MHAPNAIERHRANGLLEYAKEIEITKITKLQVNLICTYINVGINAKKFTPLGWEFWNNPAEVHLTKTIVFTRLCKSCCLSVYLLATRTIKRVHCRRSWIWYNSCDKAASPLLWFGLANLPAVFYFNLLGWMGRQVTAYHNTSSYERGDVYIYMYIYDYIHT